MYKPAIDQHPIQEEGRGEEGELNLIFVTNRLQLQETPGERKPPPPSPPPSLLSFIGSITVIQVIISAVKTSIIGIEQSIKNSFQWQNWSNLV